jgi:sucrose phosphorylase
LTAGSVSAQIESIVAALWPDHDAGALSRRLMRAVGEPVVEPERSFDQRSAMLITYADTLCRPDSPSLATLARFLNEELAGAVDSVHVLPFFPSSSDDGFAVIDHRAVRPELGDWSEIEDLGRSFRVMVDLVVNHASASSDRFREFEADRPPGRDAFFTVEPDDDLSLVTRARSHRLVRAVDTASGVRHVWCTFSEDQLDLDYRNPDVFVDLLRTVDTLLANGVRLLRLDAVAYVWKEPGTSSVHLPQTHDLVRLLRLLVAHRCPSARLVAETNVPHDENLSYLDGGDQAHLAYDFTLAPLLVQATLSQDTTALTRWLIERRPPPDGTGLLVFLASHDGLGLRPLEGLVDDGAIAAMVAAAEDSGGGASMFDTSRGPRPYELNVALADLLADGEGRDRYRRLVAAHRTLLSLAGVPALYVHSLLASPGDRAAVEASGIARRVNRGTVELSGTETAIPAGARGEVFRSLVGLLHERARLSAFSPDAPQEVLDLAPSVLAVRRGTDADAVLAVTNLSDRPVSVRHAGIEVALDPWAGRWVSL